MAVNFLGRGRTLLADGPATLPLVTFDPAIPSIDGTTFSVASGANLQTAINSAAAADGNLNHLVSVEAGATFTANFTLPPKSGSNPSGTGYIIIRSAGSLPAVGTRVLPADVAQLAKLTATNGASIISADEPSHHYWLIGLEVVNTNAQTNDLIRFGGAGNTNAATIPHYINIARCYIHQKDDATVTTRAIALNSHYSSIKDSYISGIVRAGFDTQCIWGTNGTGKYYIHNNYLQGAGENIMFGGADPAIANQLPSDIVITRNHFTKDLGWYGDGDKVKNLFELKVGQRFLIEGNVLENSYEDAQGGHAIRLKSENQDDGAPWSETSDITIRFNIIRNVTNPFSMSDTATEAATAVPLNNVSIHDNLVYDIGEAAASSSYPTFMSGNIDGVSFINNTIVNSDTMLYGFQFDAVDHLGAPAAATDVILNNNIFPLGTGGIKASGVGEGTASLDLFAPGEYTYAGNVEIGSRHSATYPAGNTTVAAISNVGFTNAGADDYSLAGGSVALTAGVGGTVAGADIAAVLAATAGVV